MKIVKLKIENLSAVSGLPINIKDGKLLLVKNVSFLPVQTRTLGEAKFFLKNPNAKTKAKNLYLMYRGVHFKKDALVFKKNNCSYDITAINSGLLDKEYIKTIGHHHPLKPKTNVSFPEIYEVIHGQALFLFQEIFSKSKSKRVFLIKVGQGEKIIVPPGFGHVSINTTNKLLVLANIQATGFKSDYKLFKKHRGAAYYITNNRQLITNNKKIKENIRINQLNPHKSASFLLKKNPNYKNKFSLKIVKPKKIFKTPLYQAFIKNPKKFDFLNNPEKHKSFLALKNLFKF
ncbi:MAG: glucose-6-phosphate isomerase family protein [Candidatus Shapirobacteria bacterium]